MTKNKIQNQLHNQIKWLEQLQDCSGNEEVKIKFQEIIDTLNRILPISQKLMSRPIKRIELGPSIGATGEIESDNL